MDQSQIVSLVPWILFFTLVSVFFLTWRNDRSRDRYMKERKYESDRELRDRELQSKREANLLEDKRKEKQAEEDNNARFWRERREEEERTREKAGNESGGFIVMDINEKQRGMFQDLLKGFEEYAKLKGYSVAFSVDNTFIGKIAFKFTLTNADVVVVNDRVRKDLKEYMEKVKSGDLLDDMPKIISIEEHELLVATLRNRISFLQHNYNLAQNSSHFYENIVRKFNEQPMLAAPNVYVQTGGQHTAPSYIATNSPQAVLGDETKSKNVIKVAISYKEKKKQIEKIYNLIDQIKTTENESEESASAIRYLTNIKEELESENIPDQSRLAKWLNSAKEAIEFGSFSYETVNAVKELMEQFGLS